MFLDLFFRGSNLHVRRAITMLREAHMARIEHQAAGEHHMALAKMYADRAKRLEREIQQLAMSPTGLNVSDEGPVTEPSMVYALQGRDRAKALRSN